MFERVRGRIRRVSCTGRTWPSDVSWGCTGAVRMFARGSRSPAWRTSTCCRGTARSDLCEGRAERDRGWRRCWSGCRRRPGGVQAVRVRGRAGRPARDDLECAHRALHQRLRRPEPGVRSICGPRGCRCRRPARRPRGRGRDVGSLLRDRDSGSSRWSGRAGSARPGSRYRWPRTPAAPAGSTGCGSSTSPRSPTRPRCRMRSPPPSASGPRAPDRCWTC